MWHRLVGGSADCVVTGRVAVALAATRKRRRRWRERSAGDPAWPGESLHRVQGGGSHRHGGCACVLCECWLGDASADGRIKAWQSGGKEHRRARIRCDN